MRHRELARFIADTLLTDETDRNNYVDAKLIMSTHLDGRFDLCALAQAILTRYPPKEPT